jgi:hypothetical protein
MAHLRYNSTQLSLPYWAGVIRFAFQPLCSHNQLAKPHIQPEVCREETQRILGIEPGFLGQQARFQKRACGHSMAFPSVLEIAANEGGSCVLEGVGSVNVGTHL